MNRYVSHLLNYLFYEHLISLLNILAWRGIYMFFDVYLYPDNENLSAIISLIIGYISFYILIYIQLSLQNFTRRTNFFSLNYPKLFSNLYNFFVFLSCIHLWRGYWMLFDLHIATLSFVEKSPFLFYIVGLLSSFLVLSFMRTASSINGPMSQMNDEYEHFPFHSNCFLMQWINRAKSIDNEILSIKSQTAISTLTQF